MVEKVYVNQDQKATFICPICKLSKTANISKFFKLAQKVTINVKCTCGHKYKSLLERRQHYRKETDLAGSFFRFVAGKSVENGKMRVIDLSLTGVGLKLSENTDFSEGDLLVIEFCLDDLKNTVIKKKVVVRNIRNSVIGADFIKSDYEDRALGFYLR